MIHDPQSKMEDEESRHVPERREGCPVFEVAVGGGHEGEGVPDTSNDNDSKDVDKNRDSNGVTGNRLRYAVSSVSGGN